MRENFEKAFQDVLKHEGGFVNHPQDPGGVTNLGVTKNVWESWVGYKVTADDMRRLRPDDIKDLYRARYWDAVRGDELPHGVDYAVFDAAVNSGPVRAIKWLQLTVGVNDDGKLGPKTLHEVFLLDPDDVVEELCDRRMAFLMRLPTWKTFGKGWRRRVIEVKAAALKMTVLTLS